MSTYSSQEAYFDQLKTGLRYDFGYIAVAAALAVSTVPLLWITSCGPQATSAKHGVFRVSRRWMIASLSLYLIYLLLTISGEGLSAESIARYIRDNGYAKRATGNETARGEAYERLPGFMIFVNDIADIAISITIVEVGRGLVGSAHETTSSTSKRRKPSSRIVILAWTAVLFAFAVAFLAFIERLSTDSILLYSAASTSSAIDISNRTANFWAGRRKMINLRGFLDVIWWATSLPLLAYSIYVVRNQDVKSRQLLHKSAILLLVASGLNVFRFTYRFILSVLFTWVANITPKVPVPLVTLILENVPEFVALALLVTIIMRGS
ncbi:hypothetical protein B0T19DRAFT_438391 [Cercophora scortea]|uniref:Uncharacterized protein n=1 Tax=Cercophora scortea TaxID=314031 RepID=A0AAE0J6C1_9PEZI|nr:hypothetical protein B0T19DRAFT_438391 [Cercophora scortea]